MFLFFVSLFYVKRIYIKKGKENTKNMYLWNMLYNKKDYVKRIICDYNLKTYITNPFFSLRFKVYVMLTLIVGSNVT